MENHPIPQDVTGFQFKLIGNMTVKQFAYLASGIVFAWILFQLPINILIKFPFCAFSAILGVGLAYFPISGRPMDTMIGNYIKALFRPTQFVYEKVGGQIYFPNKTPFTDIRKIKQYKNDFSPFPKDKLKAYLQSLNTAPKNKIDEKEKNFLMSISSLAANVHHQRSGSTPSLNVQRVGAQPSPTQHDQPKLPTPQNVSPALPTTPAPPLIKPELPQRFGPIIKGFNKTTSTLGIPDSPNIITGITKDSRSNALPSILIEVKDKDGNPVRAFKTNELGRFASATPLANGTYTIEFEDPKTQNKFEKISINVAGQIIMPIEAISIDMREELRRSLFAQGTKIN